MAGIRSLVLALAVQTAVGCTRGPAPAPAPAAAAQTAVVPDEAWLEGRLPPEVTQGKPVPGGTLVVRLHAEPSHLSPHLLEPTDLMATRITLGRVYDTLLRIDSKDHPRYQLIPSAAESYVESDDHRTYTFRLRKGMRFHDGHPVTAHDVAATLAKVLDPKEPTASARSSYGDLQDFRALDDFTLRVTLRRPYFLFLRQLATTLPILPKHLLDKAPFRTNPLHRAPVGSGPWRFAGWKTMQQIVLERNEGYWGRKPYLERVVFRIVPDHTAATQAFERGEFDVMTQIQHSVWVNMLRNPDLVRGYNRVRFYGKYYEWVGWNAQRPFFADKRVRRALAMLFDRDSFNRTALFNLEKPTVCHFYHASEDCDPTLAPLPYDPVEALRLLEQAGWRDHDGDGVLDKDGVPFRFGFLMPANSVFLGKLSVVLKEAYRKVGIEMDIERAEWAVMMRRVHDRNFDACSMLWGDTDAESDPFQVWHSSQAEAGSNFVGFRHPGADALIEKARTEFDAPTRHALYREFGRVLYEEQPYMWLNLRPELDAVSRRVRGIRASLNFYNFDDVWLAPTPGR